MYLLIFLHFVLPISFCSVLVHLVYFISNAVKIRLVSDFLTFHGRCLFLLLSFPKNLDSRCLFSNSLKKVCLHFHQPLYLITELSRPSELTCLSRSLVDIFRIFRNDSVLTKLRVHFPVS